MDLIHTAVSVAASTSPGFVAGLPAGPRIGAALPAAAHPVPTFLAPPPPPSPFTPQYHSTQDASINEWYRKAAAAREARHPVYRATSAPSELPSKELALLAERFRTAAAAKQVGGTHPPSMSCSADDSFATANLSNNSILESDFLDNSIALTPVSVPVPVPPPTSIPPLHPTPLLGPGFNGVWFHGFGFGKLVL
jgi:hypothetical protein